MSKRKPKSRRAAGAKKTRKAMPPDSTLEPYTIEEWNDVVRQALGNQQYFPKLIWLETKNGTLWPHKVVRE